MNDDDSRPTPAPVGSSEPLTARPVAPRPAPTPEPNLSGLGPVEPPGEDPVPFESKGHVVGVQPGDLDDVPEAD